MEHGEVRTVQEVCCIYCLEWLRVEGDDPDNELWEHEAEYHD